MRSIFCRRRCWQCGARSSALPRRPRSSGSTACIARRSLTRRVRSSAATAISRRSPPILAKTDRDAMLVQLDREYPVYGFCRHKGYSTPEHLAALATHGPCAAHRRSFAPSCRYLLISDDHEKLHPRLCCSMFSAPSSIGAEASSANCVRLGAARGLSADWGSVRRRLAPGLPSCDGSRAARRAAVAIHRRIKLDDPRRPAARLRVAAQRTRKSAELNNAWHRLRPWADSVEGLTRLKRRYVIGTLSNGNVALLVDMAKNGRLPWDCVLSAELFHHYKPDPEACLGAAALLLGLAPREDRARRRPQKRPCGGLAHVDSVRRAVRRPLRTWTAVDA